MRKKASFDFDTAQLRDAANKPEKIVLSSDFPLGVPALWKLIPFPVFLICLSFFITERYELLGSLTAVERQAIGQIVNQLELLIDSTDEGPLIAKIRETVNKVTGKANYKSKSSGQSESTPRSGSSTQGADNRSTQGNLEGYL